MNEIVMYMLAGACVMFLSLLLYSCDDKLDVKQDYDFSLTSWHLPSDIRVGEAVEIRLTLTRKGDYVPAKYYIGYIQMEGVRARCMTVKAAISSTGSYTLWTIYRDSTATIRRGRYSRCGTKVFPTSPPR